ncbi:GSCOCG00003395001-RA-CDS, partial [Cotesia congregata]
SWSFCPSALVLGSLAVREPAELQGLRSKIPAVSGNEVLADFGRWLPASPEFPAEHLTVHVRLQIFRVLCRGFVSTFVAIHNFLYRQEKDRNKPFQVQARALPRLFRAPRC